MRPVGYVHLRTEEQALSRYWDEQFPESMDDAGTYMKPKTRAVRIVLQHADIARCVCGRRHMEDRWFG